MGIAEIVLMVAAGLAGAFVVHELLCAGRGEVLVVSAEHMTQARLMFWLMAGGLVLVGASLLFEPGPLSGLLALVVGLLAAGWHLRGRRMRQDE